MLQKFLQLFIGLQFTKIWSAKYNSRSAKCLFTKSNDEVLTTSRTCTYLIMRLKLFQHMRTRIFCYYPGYRNLLPPENLIFFYLFKVSYQK